ncbi:HAD family hydrolase [Ningiella sp. W23]|uniref:HAD family hydrolase n=1 Tax=Ningiella sp. W23 TaxID=3023715 RepID=UPI00375632F9
MFSFCGVKGIIFDLDDTLVHANLDFKQIKSELNCPTDSDILAYIDSIPCPLEKKRAIDLVLRHELEDAKTARSIKGATHFIAQARAHDLPLAIVTRNCRAATDIKLQNTNIEVDIVITREDAPPKPDPHAILQIAALWGHLPENIAYIGDYIYDIQAAHNADAQAWLFTFSPNYSRYSDNLTRVFKE